MIKETIFHNNSFILSFWPQLYKTEDKKETIKATHLKNFLSLVYRKKLVTVKRGCDKT